jgi:predicted phosphate transport protein (TIGR00153 family)
MGLQSLIRLILPREDHFYSFLERQAEVAHEGARALARFGGGGRSAGEVRDEVQSIEHDGDRIVHELEEALARTFVTPIDREDLQSLSSALDDVLDLTNDTARACALYGVDAPSDAMTRLIDALVRCTAVLRAAVPHLGKQAYSELVGASREVRQLEKDADLVYREAIRALFHAPAIEARVLLRDREVLQHLEDAINHCERVADRLTNLAVKHG